MSILLNKLTFSKCESRIDGYEAWSASESCFQVPFKEVAVMTSTISKLETYGPCVITDVSLRFVYLTDCIVPL